MTPKEKALNLHNKFYVIGFTGLQRFTDGNMIAYDAIQSALIAVDEILSFIEDERDGFNWKNYWQQVKLEIQSL